MKKKKGVTTLPGEALHENQDGAKHPVEPPKDASEGSKFASSPSDAELGPALNKFFGGPPYCLILPECIKAHTKPRTHKRVCKGRVQSFRRSYPIVSWMDVLSEATTADKFQLQDNGMYWCHVKGRVVEMSAENYHFISLGYPQRMMQSSRPSEAQREKETAGDVGGRTNSLTSEDDPTRSDITTRAQDGSTGSSDGPKPSQPDGSNPTNKGKQPAAPVRPKKQNVFIPWTPSPKKGTHTQSAGASNISRRAGPPVRYSPRELDEGPAFIKALIEAGTSWEEQEKLYASKFGISRSQFRLVKKFDLLGMKDGGFEKAAFKSRSEHSKPQSTSANMDPESSVPTGNSQENSERDKGKKRDPGPSDAA
ncbi:hypothetical protein E8E15_008589 [Penicillium rubens]|nr:hypothetical protein E8E15_008589 [Penicillium rubens]KAJ5034201.1 hypothetical protein NUH16_005632 [Penicillium rubens]